MTARNPSATAVPDPTEGGVTTMSEEHYFKFREFFYRKTGVYFEDGKRYFVDRRLLERVNATASSSFNDYFLRLRLDESGRELQALVNALMVNETYFFREEYQLECLVNSMLNEIVARKRRGAPIRIWSVPCSSGEEPYSLAIYLLEHWPPVDRYDIELFASDIDTESVLQAGRGIYEPRSLQHLPTALRDKYFTPHGEGSYRIGEALRESVEFSVVNLMDPQQTRNFREMDVIFCRNMLIYFDDVSRRRVAEVFFDALAPGGFICLGHSESMSRISPLFQVRRFADAIVYQRPL